MVRAVAGLSVRSTSEKRVMSEEEKAGRWRDDDQDLGYSGVFGRRPMSGVGFVTLSVLCVKGTAYFCLLFVKTFYSLQ